MTTGDGSDPAAKAAGYAVLARTSYVLLTTFRKDGRAVPTPVWAAPGVGDLAGELLVWTNPNAGKVKRIRRSGHVLVQPCDRRGRPVGRGVPATARVLAPHDAPAVLDAIRGKYGLLGRLTLLPQRFTSRPAGALAVRLGGAASAE
ncbi:PPOX class F420-dependent oxidoreductase [Nakamurella flavida]|uniref:PPOX class F420-dependent oxidoreductase n=1 Tax=Nakamurella flavida TaxID=363630 RepID=A0A938YC44_9ACTN|nr:PPOX class F420-dependent oxidoreductase [Nakamurella flavida]MBM9474936.1 PPOX class F420-dependent oxidoreductase [Nakamurella flavida]MDP9776505.1 PPOX class probable F420-dependent enzyme [Nakamurella flavida]